MQTPTVKSKHPTLARLRRLRDAGGKLRAARKARKYTRR